MPQPTVPLTQNIPQQQVGVVPDGVDREALLYADLEKRKRQTLAESIETVAGQLPNGGIPPVVNYNGQQLLTSLPQQATMQNQMGQPVSINEAALQENVRKLVNNHLVENLSPILEEAIKNTVIEMYAIERIKEVLYENKDLIKKVVYETIRELQKKKKS